MFDHLENMYGWQATTPEQLDGSYWDKTFQVYVEDKYRLGLKDFFEKQNPHARQYMLARMLEVDRQGSHVFSAEQKAQLIREYIRSVARFGIGCSANTCGNRTLQAAIASGAREMGDLSPAELKQFRQRLAQAFSAPSVAVQAASALSGGRRAAEGRALLRRARSLRIFAAPMPRLVDAVVLAPLGFAVFGLFFAASGGVGAAQAAFLRRRRPEVETLRLSR
jgi:cobaltochelatase CobN